MVFSHVDPDWRSLLRTSSTTYNYLYTYTYIHLHIHIFRTLQFFWCSFFARFSWFDPELSARSPFMAVDGGRFDRWKAGGSLSSELIYELGFQYFWDVHLSVNRESNINYAWVPIVWWMTKNHKSHVLTQAQMIAGMKHQTFCYWKVLTFFHEAIFSAARSWPFWALKLRNGRERSNWNRPPLKGDSQMKSENIKYIENTCWEACEFVPKKTWMAQRFEGRHERLDLRQYKEVQKMKSKQQKRRCMQYKYVSVVYIHLNIYIYVSVLSVQTRIFHLYIYICVYIYICILRDIMT